MLNIYNTLTGEKETFQPLQSGKISMYACGVTVYDESHLGHARSALVFDVIRRYVQFSGYAVTYVRNFTDVDDKIIARASKEGVSCQEVVDRNLHAYRRDMSRLGIPPADVEPRATEHIADIIRMIEALMEKGHAYTLEGDVYYEVASFSSYGRLSKRKPEDMLAGARVEVDERKRSPMDFALWKSSKPGEPAWDSPWGPGRPGWHIECSAMAIRHLGETFDIHGGGMDLIFPHHENEIAQSCAATGREFARYWVHNGFVRVNQEKMSKSLGNFFTIREVFEKWTYGEKVTAEVLRYFLLSTQYRSPLDFSDQALREAKSALDGFYDLFQRLDESPEVLGQDRSALQETISRMDEGFRRAMDDDFNTPVALAQFQQLRGETNRLVKRGLSSDGRTHVLETFRHLGKVLGLFNIPLREWQFNPPLPVSVHESVRAPDESVVGLTDEDIEGLLAERNEARRKKDFNRADEIREFLKARGIIIEDRPDGTSRWKR